MSNYGESASIKTPEVGDVWVYKKDYKHKMSIIREYEVYQLNKNRACKSYDCIYILNNEIKNAKFLFDDLIEYYIYIGKAKGSINDLFEVQDD